MNSSHGDGFNVIVTVDDSSERDSLGEGTESSFTTYQTRKNQVEISKRLRNVVVLQLSVLLLFYLSLLFPFLQGMDKRIFLRESHLTTITKPWMNNVMVRRLVVVKYIIYVTSMMMVILHIPMNGYCLLSK